MKNQKIPRMKSGIAVDIDETLSWTVGYWFKEMIKLFGNPEKLSVKKLISKYRYTQNVPYWQTPRALAWIEDLRHSNELQKVLPLIKNANHYLNKINKILPVAVYLTPRPEMIIHGTRAWLSKYHFPKASVICRPLSWKGNHALWKAKTLFKLYPKVFGIIDDNPELLKFFGPKYKGTIYLYDNKNIKRKDIKVVCAKNWRSLYNKIRKIDQKGIKL